MEVPANKITTKIHTIRGLRVMIDCDSAQNVSLSVERTNYGLK